MARIACAAILALAALESSAEAAFDSCTFSGGAVTATLLTGTEGTLSIGGGAIQADGANCQTATVNNTDTITVVGDDGDQERVTLDLGGGPFAPGATDEGDGTSEIEIHLDLGAKASVVPPPYEPVPDLLVLGTGGSDRFTVTHAGFLNDPLVNLNAGGAGNDADADVDFVDPQFDIAVQLQSLGGADVLDVDAADPLTLARAGAGDDDLFCGIQDCRPGPGDDDITVAIGFPRQVNYADAAGPVTIDMGLGAFGETTPGGDGDGGTDRFLARLPGIEGSPHGDTVTGHPTEGILFAGRGGDDTYIGAGDADDAVYGDAGEDELHGGGGTDVLAGGADDDTLHGDEAGDALHGGLGDDDLFGDDGGDVFDEVVSPLSAGPSEVHHTPNGADAFHGGPGTDRLTYGANGSFAGFFLSRSGAIAVDLDGVADDGESGEGDNAMPDVEDVMGGTGNDTLVGDGGPNVLRGFDGADTIRGGDGDDTLHGVGVPDNPFAPGAAENLRQTIVDEGDDVDGGPGADTFDADEGDDTLRARDGFRDTLRCGPGTDGGEGDRVDDVGADCESIALPVDLPAAPPFEAPPAPPVVTPPAPPRVSALLRLPSSRRCASRRKFTVRVRREIRGTVKAVTIFVNGRRVKRVTGTRIGLPIDLRGLPKGKIKVRLRVELNDGRVATDTRTYRTCATKKRKGRFGRRRRG
jgi:hypothetical protein